MHSFRIAAIVLSKKAFLIQKEKSEQEDKRHHKSVHYTNTWKQDIQLVVVLIYYKLYRSKLTVKTSCFGISSNDFMKKKLFGAKSWLEAFPLRIDLHNSNLQYWWNHNSCNWLTTLIPKLFLFSKILKKMAAFFSSKFYSDVCFEIATIPKEGTSTMHDVS